MAAECAEELCIYWAIFDHKISWSKSKQRKIILPVAPRVPRSSRKSVNYAELTSGNKEVDDSKASDDYSDSDDSRASDR